VTKRNEFTPEAVAVGAALKSRREASGWSAADLAEAIGYGPASIHHWEEGRRVPALRAIIRMAVVFCVEPTAILEPLNGLLEAEAEKMAG